MNQETLLHGLNFVKKYELTLRELDVLLRFFEKDWMVVELGDAIQWHRTTVHGVISRLKLRGLVIHKGRTESGHHLFGLNPEFFQD